MVTIDKNKEIDMRRSNGITCFITNEGNLTPAQVIQKYREKKRRFIVDEGNNPVM
jgi:hypothetical protein